MCANYFYDTSAIFSNSIITYREPFTICIGHDRQTDVIGIDWFVLQCVTNCDDDLLLYYMYVASPALISIPDFERGYYLHVDIIWM